MLGLEIFIFHVLRIMSKFNSRHNFSNEVLHSNIVD